MSIREQSCLVAYIYVGASMGAGLHYAVHRPDPQQDAEKGAWGGPPLRARTTTLRTNMYPTAVYPLELVLIHQLCCSFTWLFSCRTSSGCRRHHTFVASGGPPTVLNLGALLCPLGALWVRESGCYGRHESCLSIWALRGTRE